MSDSNSTVAVVTDQSPRTRVLRSLREWIRDGKWAPGERLPAEMALVARLRVSRGTVRTALRQLTVEGLVQELPGRGRKARGRIVSQSSRGEPNGLMARSIGLITEGQGVLIDDPEAFGGGRAEMAVDAGALQAVHSAGLHALFICGDGLVESDVNHLIEDMPYGVIAPDHSGRSFRLRPVLERLAGAGVRVVVTGHNLEPVVFDSVMSDHEAGGYQLTKWLLARGCRRIVGVGVTPSETAWLQARYRGHSRAMGEAGLEVLPYVLATNVEVPLHVSSEVGRESFERRVRQIAGFLVPHVLGKNRVDAIMGINDWDASVILGACRLLGLEPNNPIAVVGYDDWWNTEERQWEPAAPVATVDKLNADIGRMAVRMLMDRVEGKLPPGPQIRWIEPRLVEIPKAAQFSGGSPVNS